MVQTGCRAREGGTTPDAVCTLALPDFFYSMWGGAFFEWHEAF